MDLISSSRLSPLHIRPDEVNYARDLFDTFRIDKTSPIFDAKSAFSLFMKSKLPKSVLAQIWAYSCSDKNCGGLKLEDFIVSLRLISLHQAGHNVQSINSITTLPLAHFEGIPLPKDSDRNVSINPISPIHHQQSHLSPSVIPQGDRYLNTPNTSINQSNQSISINTSSTNINTPSRPFLQPGGGGLNDNEFWSMSDFDKNFYSNHFSKLSIDGNTVTFPTSAPFFAKSGMPEEGIKKIWNLVSNEDILTKQQFGIVMHIIRRVNLYHIPIPLAIPQPLSTTQQSKKDDVFSSLISPDMLGGIKLGSSSQNSINHSSLDASKLNVTTGSFATNIGESFATNTSTYSQQQNQNISAIPSYQNSPTAASQINRYGQLPTAALDMKKEELAGAVIEQEKKRRHREDLQKQYTEMKFELDSTKQKLEEIKIQNQSYDSQISDLEEKLHLIKLQESQVLQIVNENKQQAAQSSEVISNLEKQLVEAETLLQEKRSSLNARSNTLEQEKSRETTIKEQIVSKKREAEELEGKISMSSDELNRIQERQSQYKELIRTQDAIVSARKEQLRRILKEKDELVEDINLQKAELTRLQNETSVLTESFAVAVASKDAAKQQYSEVTNLVYSERNELEKRKNIQESKQKLTSLPVSTTDSSKILAPATQPITTEVSQVETRETDVKTNTESLEDFPVLVPENEPNISAILPDQLKSQNTNDVTSWNFPKDEQSFPSFEIETNMENTASKSLNNNTETSKETQPPSEKTDSSKISPLSTSFNPFDDDAAFSFPEETPKESSDIAKTQQVIETHKEFKEISSQSNPDVPQKKDEKLTSKEQLPAEKTDSSKISPLSTSFNPFDDDAAFSFPEETPKESSDIAKTQQVIETHKEFKEISSQSNPDVPQKKDEKVKTIKKKKSKHSKDKPPPPSAPKPKEKEEPVIDFPTDDNWADFS